MSTRWAHGGHGQHQSRARSALGPRTVSARPAHRQHTDRDDALVERAHGTVAVVTCREPVNNQSASGGQFDFVWSTARVMHPTGHTHGGPNRIKENHTHLSLIVPLLAFDITTNAEDNAPLLLHHLVAGTCMSRDVDRNGKRHRLVATVRERRRPCRKVSSDGEPNHQHQHWRAPSPWLLVAALP